MLLLLFKHTLNIIRHTKQIKNCLGLFCTIYIQKQSDCYVLQWYETQNYKLQNIIEHTRTPIHSLVTLHATETELQNKTWTFQNKST